jgi:hypothetical protein
VGNSSCVKLLVLYWIFFVVYFSWLLYHTIQYSHIT